MSSSLPGNGGLLAAIDAKKFDAEELVSNASRRGKRTMKHGSTDEYTMRVETIAIVSDG
jgi:hypothetical protein